MSAWHAHQARSSDAFVARLEAVKRIDALFDIERAIKKVRFCLTVRIRPDGNLRKHSYASDTLQLANPRLARNAKSANRPKTAAFQEEVST